MKELTPIMAASLADAVYSLKKDGQEFKFFDALRLPVKNNFDFNLNNHRIQGVSGSIVSRLLKPANRFCCYRGWQSGLCWRSCGGYSWHRWATRSYYRFT
ncbi:hypothetical protein, partial [Vibrio cincinnatiensis]|uniref:hypothetical protein n=1 Tax=Vibrio cincinnatiensis TaxID=675 RepID=UPI001EE0B96F